VKALGGMTLYDITPPITPHLRVWPGDTPPAREVLLDMRRGDAITFSGQFIKTYLE